MGAVRIGTCSWSDKTMIEAYYPAEVKTAEQRLRYYAARFDTVEADSPFYAIPDVRVAENWVARTPDDFVFHVKAFGLMTQHSVDERRLHPVLRGLPHEVNERGRVTRPSAEMVDTAFELFGEFIAPLRHAGKLGGVLMQFPPYFTALDDEHRRENLAYLERAQAFLGDAPMLVEFRHPSWVAEDRVAETLGFLADRHMAYVSVDAPQFTDKPAMPPITAATTPWAYVRLHGRNREMWFARTSTAADRFDYLYTAEELGEIAPRVRKLADETEVTWVMFNNCKYDYAPRNARELAGILGAGVPMPGPPDAGQLDLGL